MNTLQSYTEEIMQLIAKDQLQEALQEAQHLLKDNPLFYELTLQSARYSDMMQSIRMGMVDFESASIEKNKIRYALIDMLRDLEEGNECNPKIQSEIQQYLKAKEVVSKNRATITGDNNVNIQGITGSEINIQVRSTKKEDE